MVLKCVIRGCLSESRKADREWAQLYIRAASHFRDDYLLAAVDDFCAAEGWTSLGWNEMSDEDLEAVASYETTITVWCRRGR